LPKHTLSQLKYGAKLFIIHLRDVYLVLFREQRLNRSSHPRPPNPLQLLSKHTFSQLEYGVKLYIVQLKDMPLVLFQLSLERQQGVYAFELIHDSKYCTGVVRYRTAEAGLTYSRQATVPALHETRRIHTKRLVLIDFSVKLSVVSNRTVTTE
jgi:hypothetical protein